MRLSGTDTVSPSFRIAICASILLVGACLFLSFVSDAETDDPDTQPILVEEYDDGRTLYRFDLRDGPMYYCQIPSEDGCIFRHVAIATMTLDIEVS